MTNNFLTRMKPNQKKNLKMTKKLISLFILVLMLIVVGAGHSEAGTRFGGGLHYLKTLGDIKDSPEVDENAFGFMGSVLFTGQLLRLEADVEFIPDYIGSGETMIQPQAYAMVGNFIYGGVGIGIGRIAGFWQSDPFYALRAGVDFTAGSLDLDVFASYRFQKTEDFDHLGSDDLNSITFGALIRFGSK